MPLTPVTAVLFDPAYVQRQWPVLGSRLPPPPPPSSAPPDCAARPGQHSLTHPPVTPVITPAVTTSVTTSVTAVTTPVNAAAAKKAKVLRIE